MLIGLLGDIHGNHQWLKFAARQLASLDINTVIQVGDLGVAGNVRDAQRWHRTNKYLRIHGITMLVAPGNHEDYNYVDSLTPDRDGWLHFRSNILLAPRGLRTTLGGRSFVWLGGAGSVDRTLRLQWERRADARQYWWPQEAVTEADVVKTVAGGHAEVMVSHDAPWPVPEIELRLKAGQFNADDVDYAQASRRIFTRAVQGVSPELVLHGHFHFAVKGTWAHPDSGRTIRVFGLSTDGDYDYSIGVLDTDDLSARFLPVGHTVWDQGSQ